MDDRTGIWVIMTALRKLAEASPKAKIVAVLGSAGRDWSARRYDQRQCESGRRG